MNYWLFKSEPDVYGIDQLTAEPGQQCRWDGIRNYQARNHLRDTVNVGDQVLFYHSSCPRPGVAGIMEVVKAAYPDPAQFDPQSDYHDPRATQETPRWFAVDVKLVKKFAQLLPLSELKAQPQLEEMALFKQGRLSIVPSRRRSGGQYAHWQIKRPPRSGQTARQHRPARPPRSTTRTAG